MPLFTVTYKVLFNHEKPVDIVIDTVTTWRDGGEGGSR